MRGAYEALGDERDRAVADRDLQAVGTESRGATAYAGRPRDGGRPRPHRCAGTAAPESPDAGNPPVRERADADALPGREAVEQRGEGGDGAVGLGIDHEARVGKALEDVLEPRHPDTAAAERERPVVAGEVKARVGALDLGDRECLDLTPAIGLAVELMVVKRHDDAVARDVHVGLEDKAA